MIANSIEVTKGVIASTRSFTRASSNGGRVGNFGYARTWLMGMPAFWFHCS
jgi:hypothetical protein